MQNIDFLKDFNEEQIKPVLDVDGKVLVVAGAGSGKTRVLTGRIAHLIKDLNVPPSNILSITFTNKAADEMKDRIFKLVGDISSIWVSTIHSMCVKILRRDVDKIGLGKNFTIYDEVDKDKVFKRVFASLGYDEKLMKTAKNIISDAQNNCILPVDFKCEYKNLKFKEEIYRIYSEYEDVLDKSNCIDFDGLLTKTYQLLRDNKDVADYYATKFKYIHIDEFQDTNKVQFEIVRILSKINGNLFVVGDEDQSIYGWRGAKIENIMDFDKLYPDAKIYKLQRNYRSTKKILDLANCIIKNNSYRRDKELWTEANEGMRIETYVGDDENNEAQYVALQIKNLISRGDYKFSDFAVFMRLNALSRAIEYEFNKYAIPYKVYGGFKFFERKEVKDILAYFRLINNIKDDGSFLRCVSVPKRGIGDKTLSELLEFSTGKGLSMLEGIDIIDQSPINNGAKAKLKSFSNLIKGFIDYSKDNDAYKLINYILETTSFMDQFVEINEDNSQRIMNINELKNTIIQFYKDNPNSTLSDYLSSVTLSSDTDDIDSDDCVTVATIHAVKGLEFRCVFIIGLDESIMPIQRAFDDDTDMEEERRLMYVAVTRAKERLALTRARSRFMYGKRDYNMIQSRFLNEGSTILYPNKAIEQSAKKSYNYSNNDFNQAISQNESMGGYSSQYAKSMLNQEPKVNVVSGFSQYKSGTKVKHQKFGEGIVINSTGEGDKTIVNVAFKGVGMKALSVKFAPMEIIK